MRLSTNRLELVSATFDHVCAELESAQRLASLLKAHVKPGWPPGEYDRDAQRFFRDRLKEGGAAVIGCPVGTQAAASRPATRAAANAVDERNIGLSLGSARRTGACGMLADRRAPGRCAPPTGSAAPWSPVRSTFSRRSGSTGRPWRTVRPRPQQGLDESTAVQLTRG